MFGRLELVKFVLKRSQQLIILQHHLHSFTQPPSWLRRWRAVLQNLMRLGLRDSVLTS